MQVFRSRMFSQFGKAAVSCALLYLLLHAISWESLGTALLEAQPAWFLFACAAAAGVLILSAWRWQFLLKSLGVAPPSLSTLTYYYAISNFFNNFAPANLAGDFVRAGALFRQGESGMVAAGSVVLERVLSLGTLCILCVWAAIVQPLPLRIRLSEPSLYALGIGVAAVCDAALWLTRRWPALLAQRLRTLGVFLRILRRHPLEYGRAVAVTLALHIVTMLITFGTLQAVSVQFGLTIHLAVYAVAGLALALPLTIQGIGLREGVYLGLLGIIGVAPERVLASMALNYIILILFSLVGGLLFWLGPRAFVHSKGSMR